MLFKSLYSRQINTAVVVAIFMSMGLNPFLAQALSFSPQQVEQFKTPLRAQQEEVTKQTWIDISMKSEIENQHSNTANNRSIYFVDRNLKDDELAKQSVVGQSASKLNPFDYDILDSSGQATQPRSNITIPSNYVLRCDDTIVAPINETYYDNTFLRQDIMHIIYRNEVAIIEIRSLKLTPVI